ncbi:MAG: thioredoxin [Chitinophagaceae bacterium]|nr:thioredoxin [Chitinophagaceae bacterium]
MATVNGTFDELIQKPKSVLIDFYADWCGPCKVMAPILKEVKTKLGDEVDIIKIDVDKNRELAADYRIQSIPTLVLFFNGKEIWRHSGVVAANSLAATIQNKKS